ncbi:hypothetical protein EC912_10299 [Luteibacter rhizovicinus]|uniref:DUF7024 domain-containing protein n=1 Tax=Luteibacter rhizovicinus TaxID=242606 RepID=A0A4R3YRZ2_9GAMM|nr:hypothetical protein [Luteibacter rhizovicinus]TCV95755.1 hypothetical protein EC912_10299 [Luteibacter rhizovicinus]
MGNGGGNIGPHLVRGGRSLTVSATLALGACIFAWAFPYGYSASPDLAHHYGLIRWLMEHWGVSEGAASILGEMSIYPRYAHILAAVLGTAAHSPFLGMQLVATASLVVCWIALASMSQLLPGRASWMFVCTFVVLIALNRETISLDLVGHEIVVNYFFSQLAGQACFLAIVAFCARAETNKGSGIVLPFVVIALAVLMAGIHLVPAIEGLGYGLVLLSAHALSDKRTWLLRSAVLVGAVGVGVAAMYLHPAFAASRSISENNGFLPLSAVTTLPRLMLLAATTGLASLALIWISLPWHRFHLPRVAAVARHIGSAGAAIAFLCMLQAVAAAMHLGSEYAVRKYAFGLSTILLMEIALLVTVFCSKRFAQDSTRAPFAWSQPAMVLAALWIFSFSDSRPDVDAPSFLALENAATVAKETGAVNGEHPAYARGLVLGDMSNVANYLVSQAIFGAPRDGNVFAPLYDREFPAPETVGAIFSSTNDPSFWSDEGCVRTRLDGGFVVSNGQCIRARFSDACRETFIFSFKGFLSTSMMTGFSNAEEGGRWTEGNRSTITCRKAEGNPDWTQLKLDVQPFSPNGHVQAVEISINGVSAGKYSLTDAATLTVPLPEAARNDHHALTVSLSLPNALSPKEAGLSSDGRKLGLMLKRATLQ